MKTAVAVAVIAALVAAAAWTLASSQPAGSSYQVEVRDVAGVRSFMVSPEVVATVAGHLVMPEVVVTSNMMPEVLVHATVAPEVAAAPLLGSELVN